MIVSWSYLVALLNCGFIWSWGSTVVEYWIQRPQSTLLFMNIFVWKAILKSLECICTVMIWKLFLWTETKVWWASSMTSVMKYYLFMSFHVWGYSICIFSLIWFYWISVMLFLVRRVIGVCCGNDSDSGCLFSGLGLGVWGVD